MPPCHYNHPHPNSPLFFGRASNDCFEVKCADNCFGLLQLYSAMYQHSLFKVTWTMPSFFMVKGGTVRRCTATMQPYHCNRTMSWSDIRKQVSFHFFTNSFQSWNLVWDAILQPSTISTKYWSTNRTLNR